VSWGDSGERGKLGAKRKLAGESRVGVRGVKVVGCQKFFYNSIV